MAIFPHSLVYCCFLHLGPGREEGSVLPLPLLPQPAIINESLQTFALAGGESSSAMPQQLYSALLKRRHEANGDRRKALMLKIGLCSRAERGDDAKIMTDTGKDQRRAMKPQARADVRSYFGEAGRSQSL